MKIKALILDYDGVIWHDTQPVGNLIEIFDEISRQGMKVMIATNNATRVVQNYLDGFEKIGLFLSPDQIINAAIATALYMKQKYPGGGRVHIIGEHGLKHYLQEQGFEEAEEDVLAVISSLDRDISYQKIHHAANLIRDGAEFLGTNPDAVYLTPNGLAPAAGVILAALETASGKKATMIGKPEAELFVQALKKLGTKPEETLMVGDRLDTDILGGKKAGCKTGLVFSGVTSRQTLAKSAIKPDLYAEDLAELLQTINQ